MYKKPVSFHMATVAMLTVSASIAWGKDITCTPAEVQNGGKLIIKTAQPFPDIAVIPPKKVGGANFFMLNEIGSGLVSSNQFARERGAVIDIDSAMLDPKNKLFTAPGRYRFLVSKNLETDDGTPSYSCYVKFSGQKRVAAPSPSPSPAAKPQAEMPSNKSLAAINQPTQSPAQTVDQQLAELVGSKCSSGIGGLLCREKYRLSLCANKWSDNPPLGQTSCKNSQ